jgi:transcription elongation factor GreA
MSERIQITPLAERILLAKKHELSAASEKAEKEKDKLNKAILDSKIQEIDDVLENYELVKFSESNPAKVIIGARVTLENLHNGDRREYTILTRCTAEPLKGVISNESPLAMKMMNLKLGNTFKFKDLAGLEESYKVVTIE